MACRGFPVRWVEQFGSGLCNTGTYCADANDLRISTVNLGTAMPGRAGSLNCAMNFGRHWQGRLCREARDGFSPKLGYSSMGAIREGVFKSVQGSMLLSRPDDLRISSVIYVICLLYR
jgi:hypothetical protein